MPDPASATPKPGQITAMISSTAIDLPRHREAVKAACLQAGVFPIGMEELPAQDKTGVQVSLRMVEQADLYIGIYAWRYGWVPPGSDKSITEMEFDHAVKRKSEGKLKELLIFTASDDHPFTKNDIEADAEAQKKLQAFKSRASDGRVRKTFASVEELRRLVSEALLHQVKHTPAGPAHTTIPHNLPRLQPFFGREKELEHIRRALEPENRTWGALIDGPGGMGKTSLAVRAAMECTPEQFDRIVFVSIKQRELDDDGVRDLSLGRIEGVLEMLNEIARELGHGDITKSAENDRARLVLDALRPTRTLLVLDNLESLARGDRDQIFTFVKRLPQGCKAILTSRGRIGSGSEELILEKLDQQAALDTLADLALHNKELAKTSEAERIVLYRETGGKPLLLRWTAGQIGRGHCRTFTDAIAFLRSCPPGNDPLEFIFGDLVQDFTPEETQALCALTHFTLPAKLEHIAMVCQSGPLSPLSGTSVPKPPDRTEDCAVHYRMTVFRHAYLGELVLNTIELHFIHLVYTVSAAPLRITAAIPMSADKTWTHTSVPHLYRHSNGTYYARLAVGGKPTFRSLKTKVLSIAKPQLAELLQDNAYRDELSQDTAVTEKMTGLEALTLHESKLQNDPSTKNGTKRYWKTVVAAFRKSWPALLTSELRRVTVEQCEDWAGKAVKAMSPMRFNNSLLVLKSMFRIAVKRGVRRTNPALAIKRAKVRRKDLSGKLPNEERFRKWVTALREAGGRSSHYCADLVELLAYTGMRLGESNHVLWQHCDFEKGEILVTGTPEDGTKNGSFRRIPMIPAARKLLERLRSENEPASLKEPVMHIKSAYAAMKRAAESIEMAPITHHDLRHLFATICIESGVDVPTVSRWLGHRDGGVLAMKVYGHLRNEHSLLAASRVSFAA